LAYPLIADPIGHIAALYDPLAVGRSPLWRQFFLYPAGIIRQMAVSSFPMSASVEDLLHPGDWFSGRQVVECAASGKVELEAI